MLFKIVADGSARRVCGRMKRFRSTSTTTITEEAAASVINDDDAMSTRQEQFATALPYNELPGPKPLPILGNTWRVFPYIGQYQISDMGRVSFLLHETFGRIVRLGGLIGRPDLLFIFDADEIENVYRHEGATPMRPPMPCLVKYKSEIRKEFFGRLPGVVGVHGEPWREFRSKVQKPVLQPQTVKKYVRPIENITTDFIRRVVGMLDEHGETPWDFDNEIHKWSLECIGQVALDVRLGCLDGNLSKCSEPQKIIDAAKYALRNIAILELQFPFWRYLPSTLWKNYVKNMDYFVEVCMKYINEAMARLNSKSRNGEGECGHDLSLIERILATESDPKIACIFALDLMLVGIDTISMAVCSILYQLATRPEEQEKIYRELSTVLPDAESELTSTKLDQMHYLKAFIKEVLRMYTTVIGNGRTLQQDMVICGYHIPKGVQLVFPTLVTGSMSKYVSDPQKFYPERWMKQYQDEATLHPFASLPYGHGARMCLGRRFADVEMHILLAKLLRRYKLEYHHEPLQYKITFMYAPHGQLRFKVIERR